MDRIHQELIKQGMAHFYRCDYDYPQHGNSMVTDKNHTSCQCGFYVDRDMIIEEWDNELRKEYQKAMDIAAQYKMNSDRIKALLSQNPIDYDNALVNSNTGRTLIKWVNDFPYVDPILL